MSDEKTEDWLGLERPQEPPRTQVHEAQLEGLESPPEEEQQGYQAFRSFRGKRGEPMLDLRLKDGGGRLLAYGHLLDVAYDGDTHLTLQLPGCLITLKGRRLTKLRRLLQSHRVEFIEEYDPTRWPQPPADNAPLVESVTILTPGLPAN
jgi:hypothetical protein